MPGIADDPAVAFSAEFYGTRYLLMPLFMIEFPFMFCASTTMRRHGRPSSCFRAVLRMTRRSLFRQSSREERAGHAEKRHGITDARAGSAADAPGATAHRRRHTQV